MQCVDQAFTFVFLHSIFLAWCVHYNLTCLFLVYSELADWCFKPLLPSSPNFKSCMVSMSASAVSSVQWFVDIVWPQSWAGARWLYLCVGLNLAADDTPRNRHTFPRGQGSVAPLLGRNRCLLSHVSMATISTLCARCAAGDSRQTFINYVAQTCLAGQV